MTILSVTLYPLFEQPGPWRTISLHNLDDKVTVRFQICVGLFQVDMHIFLIILLHFICMCGSLEFFLRRKKNAKVYI